MARFDAPVMNTSLVAPADRASSTAYWISGLSTTGSISFGLAFVAGRNRLPRPATGNTALVIFFIGFRSWICCLRDQVPVIPAFSTIRLRREPGFAVIRLY